MSVQFLSGAVRRLKPGTVLCLETSGHYLNFIMFKCLKKKSHPNIRAKPYKSVANPRAKLNPPKLIASLLNSAIPAVPGRGRS